MKVYLDLKEFDNVELTREQRNNIVTRLNYLSKKAREMVEQKKLSKTMYNRIHRLWLFLPREEGQKLILSTQDFHNKFNIKPFDLKKFNIAILRLKDALDNVSEK